MFHSLSVFVGGGDGELCTRLSSGGSTQTPVRQEQVQGAWHALLALLLLLLHLLRTHITVLLTAVAARLQTVDYTSDVINTDHSLARSA